MSDALTCPSCFSLEVNLIGEIPATDIFAGYTLSKPLSGGSLYRCDKCGLQFRFPKLSKNQIDNLYRGGREDNWQQGERKRVDWAIASEWIRSNYKQGRILDIGCFDGAFLYSLGSSFDLHGIEINKVAAEKAIEKGIKIIGDDFYALGDVSCEFDVVMAFDIFEHVSDPLRLLKEIAKVMSKSGILMVSTGNTEAITWRLLKNRHWYCTIAEHISFISPAWCEKLAFSCGLFVDSVKPYSHAGISPLDIFPKIKETVVSLIYLFAPDVLRWLRNIGFGAKDVGKYPDLLNHPPSWITAKDHFIVKFRKINE